MTYTITVTNSGQTNYTGATFSDALGGVLDDATYNGDATASTGAVSFTSPNLTWTGDLTAGSAATVTFSVTVHNPDTGNDILASTVTSATPGSNCGGRQHRRTLQRHGQRGRADHRERLLGQHHDARLGGQVHRHLHQLRPGPLYRVTVLIPALTIVKTADAPATTPGGVVHYTVTVTDSGPTPYTGATYTDQLDGVLGDAAYNRDAAATAGRVTFASPDMTWTGDLAAGASATVTYSVTVSDPDTGDKILTNTIRSASPGSNCPAGGTDPRCTATVTDLVPGLDIVTQAGQPTATPGTVVHYTITATNTGQTAYTGAAFTDPLAGLLDDAAYNGDAAATSGSAVFASPDLTWTGDLAPGAAATITFSVTVANPDTGDKTMASTVTSATAGNNCPAAGGTDTSCTTTVAVVNATTLTFTATAARPRRPPATWCTTRSRRPTPG